MTRLKLMCVLAHPDDESLGTGGILAKYAAEGVETQLICATRGQKGWKLPDYPGPQAVGEHRTRELCAAAEVLGISEVRWLEYMDGALDGADAQEATQKITELILELAPDVVVTFGPDGAYGHPDHIAISQLTTAACMESAKRGHSVAKLYYLAETKALALRYAGIFGVSKSTVDGVERLFEGWDEWALTTQVEIAPEYMPTLREAISCHHSQLRNYEGVLELPLENWHAVFGQATFYRAFSLVNGGRELEADLFAGLRSS